jgi:hypothetical protein
MAEVAGIRAGTAGALKLPPRLRPVVPDRMLPCRPLRMQGGMRLTPERWTPTRAMPRVPMPRCLRAPMQVLTQVLTRRSPSPRRSWTLAASARSLR